MLIRNQDRAWGAQEKLSKSLLPYCAFNIFQKVLFCLALHTEQVNLQTFVII